MARNRLEQDARTIAIHLDHREYKVPTDELTGEQIRSLPSPPVSADRDLWLEVPGGSDELIPSDRVVELRDGMHFFTAPARINPGQYALSG